MAFSWLVSAGGSLSLLKCQPEHSILRRASGLLISCLIIFLGTLSISFMAVTTFRNCLCLLIYSLYPPSRRIEIIVTFPVPNTGKYLLWAKLCPSQIHMLTCTLMVIVFRGGTLESSVQVMSWGWGPHDGISALLRRDIRELTDSFSLSLCHVKTH